MSSPKKPSSALVVVDDLNATQLAAYGQTSSAGNLKSIGRMARAQFDRIHADQRNLPIRGAFLGCILIGVRAQCEQGEWLPWLEEHFKGKSKSTAYDYINIGEACIKEVKLRLPEFVSLPQLSLELTVPEGNDDARSALRKLTRFVGKRSLRELIADCREAKKRGGPTKPTTQTELQLRQARAAHFAATLEKGQRDYFEKCELDQQESLMTWWPTISTLNEELTAPQPAFAILPERERLALATALKELLERLELKS